MAVINTAKPEAEAASKALSPTMHSDVIISGAGLIGLSLALALARAGVNVQLIDRRSADAVAHRMNGDDDSDIRASAIIRSSWEMFCALGLEQALAAVSQPINAIEVRDGTDGAPLNFGNDVASADNGAYASAYNGAGYIEQGAMGQMVPNAVLAAALFDAVSAHDLVTCHFDAHIAWQDENAQSCTVVLDNGTNLHAPLFVIAEGRASSTRDAKGFVPARWQYDHQAIVATIAHEWPHGGIAHELFFADGPLAMLPLPDAMGSRETENRHRSSLVWSLPAAKAAGYLALSRRGFTAELRKILQPLFGDLTLIGERAAYPLSFHLVNRPAKGRAVVIGDGAHALHPIAGQGFNLGLRDVACLTEIVAESLRMGLDPGSAEPLARYNDWRDNDVTIMAAATDGLTRLFGISSPPVRRLRRAGMQLVGNVPAIRNLVAREARGEMGKLPRLLQGLDV